MHHGLLQISASAGSGKTFTLAKRYIMLLLFEQQNDRLLNYRRQADYHSHILAITFTNKATNEMKQRIIDELYILATQPGKSEFLRDFNKMDKQQHCFAPGVLNPAQIQQAARQALAGVLFNYGVFNVSTIDSFFQSILRNFARELDRDYNYEVQIDEKFALKTAIHNFLLSLGADARRHGKDYKLSDVEKWVQSYIQQRISEGYDWNIFKDDGGLLKSAELLNKELFRQQMPQLHEYLTKDDNGVRVPDMSKINKFKQCCVKLVENYEQQYSDLGQVLIGLVSQHGVDVNFVSGNSWLANYLKPDNKVAKGEQYSSTLNDLTEELLLDKCFKSMGKGKGKYRPSDDFVNDVMAWREKVIFTYQAKLLLHRLVRELGVLGLLDRVDDNVKQYSRETNQLLIADTNDLIARVLQSGVPFLYERVGTWINHFMIDEFQDTSRKQYENFKPLLEEALARIGENLCMLIGDAKQSIYRFRNADPSLFRDQIASDFTPGQHGLMQQTLDTNYRSCPAIIQFNNWLFDQLLQRLGQASDTPLMRTYMPNGELTDFQQLEHKKDPQGMVRVQLFKKNDDSDDKEEQQVLKMLPDYLKQLHERFDWRDIGILVNTNDEGKEVVTRIMEYNKTVSAHEQISVASDESMLIASSASVKRIVSLLRFIDLTQYSMDEESEDNDSIEEVDKRANKRRLSDQHMYHVLGLFMQRMAQDETQSPGEVLKKCFRDTEAITRLDETNQIEEYAKKVDQLLPDRRTQLMTLPNIVEHIIAQYMQDTNAEPQETAYLLAFQDCVSDFSTQRGGGTVREFLNYWDARSDSLTVPASASNDAVSVLTIHKSKGLEFACVVIPMAKWKVQGDAGKKDPFWVSRDQLLDQGGKRLFALDPDVTEQLIPPLLPLTKSIVKVLAENFGILKEYADKFTQDLLVDNMDKTYVAFTRPKRELHVWVKQSSEIGKALQPILEQGAEHTEVKLKRVGEMTFQWGEPTVVAEDKDQGDAQTVVMVNMPPYRVATGDSRITVRLPKDLTDKQNTGKRLHNLMSRIAYRRDLERAWGFCLNRGIIGDDDNKWPLSRLRAIVERMFDDPRTRDWFADDNLVYNERNLSADPESETTKRPDRVVRRPDGTWIVIDYKFGGKDIEANTKQVKGYIDNLASMGKQPIKGYLWYVGLDEIIEVNG